MKSLPPHHPPEPPDEDTLETAFGVRRSIPAFLFSTVFHAVLLVVLASFSFAVVQKLPERIKVKILDQPASVTETPEDFEGMPSIKDVVGTLRPVRVAPADTRAVAGPTSGPSAPAAPRAAVLPRIPLGPTIGAEPGNLDIPLSPLGAGGLAGPGGGGGFGNVVQGFRKTGVDLALVIDTTGSMQSVLEEVRNEVRGFIGDLQAIIPTARVAVVAYRDKGEEYVTKWVDFSYHTSKVQAFVAGLRADGGGDYEEAVKQGIEAAINELSWGKRTKKIIILIGGTPPHKTDVPELMRLVREFRDKDNGAIGAIDVTKRLHDEYERDDWVAHGSVGQFTPSPMPGFYRETTDVYGALANAGGGELVTLGEQKVLLRQVAALTFGTRWRAELAAYLPRLQ